MLMTRSIKCNCQAWWGLPFPPFELSLHGSPALEGSALDMLQALDEEDDCWGI